MVQPRRTNKVPKRPFLDPIIERVQQAQNLLLKEYGSYDALVDHLQEMDRQRARKKRAAKRSAGVSRRDTAKPSREKRRTKRPFEDEITRRVREAREGLLKEHGGFDNYVKHLQELDQQRIASKKATVKSHKKKSA